MSCVAEVAHPFSTVAPCRSSAPAVASGPGSNTGQKGGALIDYLTVVIPLANLEARGLSKLNDMLATLFGIHREEVYATQWQEKRWQFYPVSAVLLDREGELVGRAGMGANGESICISLSGAGTRWITNWSLVQKQLTAVKASISRVDLAFDDYDGSRFKVGHMRQIAHAGGFMDRGAPPKCRFIDDEGSETGCTLYVGSKGHKELCIYEKGKALGMKASPWVRAEIRLYKKHGEIPHGVLCDPLAFIRGAYEILDQLLLDVCETACTRIKTDKRMVEASGEAMVAFLRRQVGPSLNLLLEAFGGSWADFMQHRIVREGSPGRFRGHLKGEQLAQSLREELCRALSSNQP